MPADTFDLEVTGLNCGSCVNRAEQAIRRVPGVELSLIRL